MYAQIAREHFSRKKTNAECHNKSIHNEMTIVLNKETRWISIKKKESKPSPSPSPSPSKTAIRIHFY
ncbi:MAG: hypothetical protein M3Z01_04525 [Thermoproteota archaeon]|nr:hypothetical protein [Thermoproteota archaeon]